MVAALSIIVPLSYENERPIFSSQFSHFSRLATDNINVIFSVNNFSPYIPCRNLPYNVLVLTNEDAASKADNIISATMNAHCGEYVIVFDFNEIPSNNTIDCLMLGDIIYQGPKIFKPSFANILSYMCFFESLWRYLFVIPFISHIIPDGIVLLGSNFVGPRSDIKLAFKNNNCISEDLFASLLLSANGKKIRYDKNQITFELSPPNIKAWALQRIKWSIGLAEILFLLPRLILNKPRINIFMIIYVLNSAFFIPLITIVSYILIVMHISSHVTWLLLGCFYVVKIVECSMSFLFARKARFPEQLPETAMAMYLILIYPVYEACRLAIKALGFCSYLLGIRKVASTSRGVVND